MDTQYKKDLWKEFELDDAVEFDAEALDEFEVKPVTTSKSSQRNKDLLRRQIKRSSSAYANAPQRPASLRFTKSFPDPASASAARFTTEPSIDVVKPSQSVEARSNALLEAKSSQMPSRHTRKQSAIERGPQRGSKRKRDQPIIPQPESRQHFKGFVFFYLPNNDVNPIRRVQIRKAIEYGAVWAQEWGDDITHIVADSDLTHQDVVSWITKNCIDSIPDTIILVKSNYPTDCIHYGFKLDPKQSAYYVKGYIPPQQGPATKNVPLQSKQANEANLAQAADEPVPGAIPNATAEDATNATQAFVDKELGDNSGASQTQQSSLQVCNNAFDDDLSKEIKEAQATKDLPLDFDDEDESSSSRTDADGNTTSDDEELPPSRSKRPMATKSGKNSFMCMSKHDGSEPSENPNASTINTLQQMANVYDRLKDQWRTLAYRRAINQLKKQTEKILTKEQAQQLPHIGERLALKIQEIATTNRLRRLENAMLEPDEEVLKLFLGIYGVGTSQAYAWLQQGHRKLADLTSGKVELTRNQQIGIERYEDFNARIPRSEMTLHDDFVRRFASRLDPELQFTIAGSFRRGASSSGDIDFIVTKPGASAATIKTIMLDRVIRYLLKADYLKAGLSIAHHSQGTGSKWHGACSLPRPKGSSEPPLPWRRIDFLFVPWDEIGAALLYFTGNDIFNRSIRLLASKKRMRLNQHGLYKDVMRGPSRKRLTEGTLVESHDEKKIFAALGVPWRAPWERAC